MAQLESQEDRLIEEQAEGFVGGVPIDRCIEELELEQAIDDYKGLND